ncbi:uncharacterized protein TEOVI_000898100 [Trypanosoma equiperdum]|uniref:Uncharacterized protein n=2 Tax=Trypanozoon TaxID=39700 RepID=Q387J5_TRYB2|nr:hypothetical protein, conserved [Trypanosoma brucei brucei TREU927]EAN79036.1 hypothetical protein, conserved [Trypanosoma brucei brucei TREU927]SCU64884.1 hypothetical protein, conserved [Trypanosoma equiperdum]
MPPKKDVAMGKQPRIGAPQEPDVDEELELNERSQPSPANGFSPPVEVSPGTRSNTKPCVWRVQQTEGRRKEALKAMLSPTLAGRRAAVWLQEWDRGSRSVRLRILEAFLTLHSESNSRRIEVDLGDASILFFTRITAWLRLTYKLGVGLRSVLSAISVFIRGVRYLTCFAEVGGATTLADTLATGTLCVEDRQEAVLLLLYIANAGRVYREMICDENGVELLIEAMRREEDEKILDLFSALFLAVGEGSSRSLNSPVYLGLIRLLPNEETTAAAALYAARTLRTYQTSWEKKYMDSVAANNAENTGSVPVVGINPEDPVGSAQVLLDSLFALLYHSELTVRAEGSELLALVSKNLQLTGKILSRCLDVVDENRLVVEIDDDVEAIHNLRRHQITLGTTAVKVMLTDWDFEARRRIIVGLVARRSTHFTLLKFLRLLGVAQNTNAVDCCRLVQLLCREAVQQNQRGREDGEGSAGSCISLDKFSKHIHDVVGSALYSVILHEDLVDEQIEAIVRSIMSSD